MSPWRERRRAVINLGLGIRSNENRGRDRDEFLANSVETGARVFYDPAGDFLVERLVNCFLAKVRWK